MTGKEIELSEQRQMLRECRAKMVVLCEQGDDFLAGHYAHILGRIDAVLAISEADASDVLTD